MNENTRPRRYPVGTVLWRMVGVLNGCCGQPKDNKIHWLPEAYAIQDVKDSMFFHTHGGASWNAIGKSYFLTREECIAAWKGDTVTDPPKIKPEETKDLNGKIIYRDDDMALLTITFDKMLVPPSDLEWRHNSAYEIPGKPGSGEFLTLEEISDQLVEMTPDDYRGFKQIEVRIDEPLSGVIYRYNQYRDGRWNEYGKLQGYA